MKKTRWNMDKIPCLRDLQIELQRMICAAGGIRSLNSERDAKIFNLISSNPDKAAEAIYIYNDAYFLRLLECLSSDFSRTAKVLGKDTFDSAISKYLTQYPSTYFSINEVGKSFPMFLDKCTGETIPEWISDLAQFEWKWIECFYAKEVKINSSWKEKLANNPRAKMLVNPSVYILKSKILMAELLKKIDSSGGQHFDPLNEESFLLLYRFLGDVHWQSINKYSAIAIQSLMRGKPLEEALLTDGEINTEEISKLFSFLVEREIICGVIED